MFILSVLLTLFTAVAADNLVLYYPVYPQYVVPEQLQSFERNAPPRIFARDPDIPSSGIVFLQKDLRNIDWKAQSELEKSNNIRQKLHSDRSNFTQRTTPGISRSYAKPRPSPGVVALSDAPKKIDYTKHDNSERGVALSGVTKKSDFVNDDSSAAPPPQVPRVTTAAAIIGTAILQPPRNTPIRVFAKYDTKLNKFVPSNQRKLIRRKEQVHKIAASKIFPTQLSKAYHVETVYPVPRNNSLTKPSTLTELPTTRNQFPFKPDYRTELSTIKNQFPPDHRTRVISLSKLIVKAQNQDKSKPVITMVDGDASIKSFKFQRLL